MTQDTYPPHIRPLLLAAVALLGSCGEPEESAVRPTQGAGIAKPDTGAPVGGFPALPPTGGGSAVGLTSGPGLNLTGAPSPAVQDPINRSLEQELLLRSARSAVALGHTAEALELFDSYLIQTPTDQAARDEYAGLLVQDGQLAKARDMFEESVGLMPQSSGSRRSLIDVLIIGGEYAEAARHLELIVTQDGNDVEAAALLCRAYTWVKDLERAEEIFDRNLTRLDPSSDRDQRILAPVLLDLQRPEEALPQLERLHTRNPRELTWAASLVLCYELLGEADRAAKQVQEMAEMSEETADARIHLVDQLLSMQNFKLAMQVNQQILVAEPDNSMAKLMSARILLGAYDVRRAREALDDLASELAGMRRFKLARAQLHKLTGDWATSQGLFESMLQQRPNDDSVRIELALLHREKGDLHRSKAELRKVPATSPYAVRAQVELARSFIIQGNHEAGAAICANLADERPNDPEPVVGLAKAHLEMGNSAQALAMCQRFIETHTADPRATAQVRVAMGMAQLQSGNAVQAAQTFKLAIELPTMRDPEAYYGLALARARGMSEASGSLARMSSTIVSSGEDIRRRIELGKLALGDQEHEIAEEFFSTALRWQPNNTAAMILMGEAENLALKAGKDVDPTKTFMTVLTTEPTNARARLGLARSYAIQRDFDTAIKEYEALVAQDGSYDLARREYARALFWDHRYEASFEAYELLIAGLPDELLSVDLLGVGNPGGGPRLEADFEGSIELSQAVELELNAKRGMDWRPALAAVSLEKLLVLEPSNQEALFDLAQIEHRRGDTNRALELYDELITISGGHTEAKTARAGALSETQASINLATGSQERVGRGNLASMTETWTLADVQFPLGDREDYFGIGIGHRSYDGGGEFDPTITANSLRLLGSTRLSTNTVLNGTFEVPSYDRSDYFSSGLNGDAGVKYTSDKMLSIDLRLFRAPFAENNETMRRNLHRMGGRIGVAKKISPEIDFGGSLMVADYSDGNTLVEVNTFGSYELMPAPMELRLLLRADFLQAAEESSGVDDPNMLPTVDVPYFSPTGYSVYSAQADWKHDFGEDWFTGSKDMYYRATGRLAVDSNAIGYVELDMGVAWDVTKWLRMEGGFGLLRSSEIDISSANLMVTLLWP